MPPKRPGDADSSTVSHQNEVTKKPRMSGPETSGPISIHAQLEAAKARAAALAASLAKSKLGQGPAASAGVKNANLPLSRPASSSGGGLDIAAMQRQLAEARRRADQMASGTLGQLQKQREDQPKQGGIHPLLMASSSSASTVASRAPKFSSISANARKGSLPSSSVDVRRKEEILNPYLSTEGQDEERVKGRNMHRSLQFHKPGRHVREAEEARREAQMEALKKRIQESAKKAGMEELGAEERALRRTAPPEVEWWDQALLPGKTYEVIRWIGKGKEKEAEEGILIECDGTPIDIYIQHPIPIPAPSDKLAVESRGVMLTKKEMKKMRKQRRLADQEDKRDKIKMGLLPPDPPKVKLSNLMRVLTSEAVADPTKVEARVRREVAARKEIHEQTNLENQLTPELRRAKLEEKKAKDLEKGIYMLVFKIKHLVSPSHKFKVRKNALQFGLTGLAIFEKKFALVVVEGGQKSIKNYRKLMTVRIDWNDPGRPKADSVDDLLDLDEETSTANSRAKKDNSKEQLEIEEIDWHTNYCKIIFEGPVRESHFRFGFKAHYCDHESGAKEVLGPKLASFWDLAKRFDVAREE
ncbi:hypothetical protein CBS101457_004490 [Exobasidium rhododendri]|nr:hypothetical protein CBS101457_004490 [Exobasidium rhododendri]